MQAEVCILPCLISQCSCISNFESVVLMHLHSVSWIVAVVRWELHQFVTTLPLSAVQLLIFLFFFTHTNGISATSCCEVLCGMLLLYIMFSSVCDWIPVY